MHGALQQLSRFGPQVSLWAQATAVCALALLLCPISNAQTADNWDGSSSAAWSTKANWSLKGGAPSNSLTSNYAYFSSSNPGFANRYSVTLDTTQSVAGIKFGTGAFTLSQASTATTLTLGSIGIVNTGSSVQTVTGTSLSLALGAASSFAVDSSGNLTISPSGISNGGFGLTLTGSSTGVGTIAAPISGTGALTKSGSGAWVLSGVNTFTGGTTVSAGTLTVNSGAALGDATGGLTVNGGTLNLNNAAQTVSSLNGTGGTIALGTGHAFTVNDTGTDSYAGAITGAAGTSVTKTGTGTLTLSGDNSGENGTIVVSGGTVVAGSATALGSTTATTTVNSGAALGFSGGIALTSGSGASGITVSGAGAGSGALYNVSGTNSYSGNITLAGNTTLGATAGTLTLGTISESSTSGVTKTGAGSVVYSAVNTYTGGTTVSAGNLTVNSGASLAAATGTLTVNGGTLNLNNAAQTVSSLNGTGGTIALGTGHAFTVNDSGTDSFAGALTGAAGTSVTKTGTGTLTLSGTNSSFNGTVNVSSGTLIAGGATALGSTTATTTVSSGAALGFSGAVAVTSGSAATSGIKVSGSGVSGSGALYNVSGSNSYAGVVTLLGDTTINANAGTLTFSGNIGLDSAAAANTTLTLTPTSGAAIVLNGVVTDKANVTYALNLAQTGSGTVTLGNAGDATGGYYGNTTIGTAGGNSTGTLRMGAAGALPTRNNASLITVYSGTLDLNNFNNTAQGGLSLGGGAAGSTAAITTGTGTLTLNHDLTFNAATNPNGATISGSLALASGTHLFTIGDSSNAAADLTIAAAIADGSGPAEIDKYGTGTMVLSGNNTYTSLTTVQQGVLNVQSNTALGATSSGSTVSAGATLQLNGSLTIGEALTIAGTGYGGNGALENATGNSTWTGGITLNNTTGRIQADGSTTLTIATNTLGATGNGTLEVGGTGTVKVTSSITSGVLGNIVAVNKKDSGTLILAGSNTFAGPIDVQGGTVSIQNNNALGTTATTATVESGAALAFDSTANGNLNTASGITTLNVNGSGIGGAGAVRNTAGSNTYNGSTSIASASTITANAGTSLTFGGNVSGSGTTSLTVGTTSQNGNITISGAFNGVNLTKNGAINSGNDGTLTIAGGGSIGTVALNQGRIAVQSKTLNTGDFTAAAGSSLLIASGGTVNITGNAVFNSATLDGSGGALQVNGQHSLTFNGTINAPNLTLTLAGGSVGTNLAPLTVYLSGANVTVGSIIITGDTILDFGNSAGTVLSSGALTLQNPNAKVEVRGWTSTANNTLLSTIWYATSTVDNTTLGTTNQKPPDNSGLGQISFTNPQGSTGNTTTWVADTSTGWFDHEIRPTPEPATYGVIFLSGCVGLLGFRRLRQRSKRV